MNCAEFNYAGFDSKARNSEAKLLGEQAMHETREAKGPNSRATEAKCALREADWNCLPGA